MSRLEVVENWKLAIEPSKDIESFLAKFETIDDS